MLASVLGDPAGWLLNNGVGQNLTAGLIVFAGGLAWSRTKYWPLRALHRRLDALHASHRDLHSSHRELHAKLDRIERHVNSKRTKSEPAPAPGSPGSRWPDA